jgi:hypothetical protein
LLSVWIIVEEREKISCEEEKMNLDGSPVQSLERHHSWFLQEFDLLIQGMYILKYNE